MVGVRQAGAGAAVVATWAMNEGSAVAATATRLSVEEYEKWFFSRGFIPSASEDSSGFQCIA